MINRCDFKSQNLIYTQTLSFSVFIRNKRNKSDCTYFIGQLLASEGEVLIVPAVALDMK